MGNPFAGAAQAGKGAAAYVRAGMKVESRGVGQLADEFKKLEGYLDKVRKHLKDIGGKTGQDAARVLKDLQGTMGGGGGGGGYLPYKPQDLAPGRTYRVIRPSSEEPPSTATRAASAPPTTVPSGAAMAAGAGGGGGGGGGFPWLKVGVGAALTGAALLDRRISQQEPNFAQVAGTYSSFGAMLNMSRSALNQTARQNMPYAQNQLDYVQGTAGAVQWGMGRNPQDWMRGLNTQVALSGGTMSYEQAGQIQSSVLNPESARRIRATYGVNIMPGGRPMAAPEMYRQIMGNMPMSNGSRGMNQLPLERQRQILETMVPGSRTYQQLANAGVPTEMIASMQQYGLSQVTFQQRNGQGQFDPLNPEHQRLVGLDAGHNLGMARRSAQAAETEKQQRFMDDNYRALVQRAEWDKRLIDTTSDLEHSFRELIHVLAPFTGLAGKLAGATGSLLEMVGVFSLLRGGGGGSILGRLFGRGAGGATGAAGEAAAGAATGGALRTAAGILGPPAAVYAATNVASGIREGQAQRGFGAMADDQLFASKFQAKGIGKFLGASETWTSPGAWISGNKTAGEVRQDERQIRLSKRAGLLLQQVHDDAGFTSSADWYNSPEDYAKVLTKLQSGTADNSTYKKIMKDQVGPLFEDFTKASSANRSMYDSLLGGIPPLELWKTNQGDIERFLKYGGGRIGKDQPGGQSLANMQPNAAQTGDASPAQAQWRGAPLSPELAAWYQSAQGSDPKADPYGLPRQGAENTAGLHPALAKALKAMFAANPRLRVVSGFRTYVQQAAMRAERYDSAGNLKKGYARAAHAGMSKHELGMAADIGPGSEYGWIAKHAAEFGLYQAELPDEPWHLQLVGTEGGKWMANYSSGMDTNGIGAPSQAGAVTTGSSTTPVAQQMAQRLGTGGQLFGLSGGASMGEAFRAGLSPQGGGGRMDAILASMMGGSPAAAAGTGAALSPATDVDVSGIPSSGTLTAEQVAKVAYAAGFRGADLVTMVAVAKGESGWNPKSLADDSDDLSYGLWQINMLGSMGPDRRKTFGLGSNDDLYDPMTNARAAFSLYGSQGLNAWSVYKRKDYQKWLPEAQAAVTSLGYGSGDAAPTPNTFAGVGGGGGGGGGMGGVYAPSTVNLHFGNLSVNVQKASDAEARRFMRKVMEYAQSEAGRALVMGG